jgi:hypothetical protein
MRSNQCLPVLGNVRWFMSTLARWYRWARLHPYAADVALAAVLYAITLLTTAVGPQPWRGTVTPAAVVAAGVAYGALVFRRRSLCWRWPPRVLPPTSRCPRH